MTANIRRIADVSHRKRIPARAIRQIVEQIVEQFSPRKVILFGSYARGNPRPESDVDLLVVMATRDEGQQSLLIRRAIPYEFGLDLIVRTPETLCAAVGTWRFFPERDRGPGQGAL